MKTVYVFTRRDTPETYKECTQMDCSDCEFGEVEDNLMCDNKRRLYHEAHQDAIGKISMICLAFDHSPENDGESVLRQIREIVDKELVTHR